MVKLLHGENQRDTSDMGWRALSELIKLINCKVERVVLRNINGEKELRISGAIICEDETYPIKYGVPILIPRGYRGKYRKLRVAYETLGYAPWKATVSDWIKHMRILHLIGLKEATKLLEKNNAKILAIGCGWGWEIWTVKELSKDNHFYVGLDLTRKPLIMANKLRRKKHCENVIFAVALSEVLPFKSNSFDLVIAIFGPLDHTVNYDKAFREIARVLKPGGIFYFTVLNRFSFEWIIKNIKDPRLLMKTLKLSKKRFVRITLPTPKGRVYRIITHFYDKYELAKLLKSNNFKMVKTRSIFSILLANFKSKKFSRLEKILSKIETLVSDKPIIKWLGRYIEGIAIKNG